MHNTTCSVPDCEKSEAAGGLCAMHWARVQRTGRVEGLRPRRGGVCSIEGCEEPHDSNGWCKKHSRRARHNGDPLVVRQGKPSPGVGHPHWLGDSVSYDGWHARLYAIKGRAADHTCVDCHCAARDWSYDHCDPDERQSDDGPYSLDASHYAPRCRRCHSTFDIEQARARRAVTGEPPPVSRSA